MAGRSTLFNRLRGPVGRWAAAALVLAAAVLAWSARDRLDDLVALATGPRGAVILRHGVYVNAIAWSPDSRYLAASDRIEHYLYLWHLPDGKLVFKKPNASAILEGLAFTRDGTFILNSDMSRDREIAFSVWDAKSGERRRFVDGPARKSTDGSNNADRILVSPDGRYAVAMLTGERYAVFDVSTWAINSVIYYTEPLRYTKYAGAISPDGTRIAFGGSRGQIEVRGFPDGREIASFEAIEVRNKSGFHSVQALAYSPDGRYLAVGSRVNSDEPGMQLKLWDAASFSFIREYPTGPSHGVTALSYSPDGRYIAGIGDYPSRVRVWDVTTTRMVKDIVTAEWTEVAAFSPDGKWLAYGDGAKVHVIPMDGN